MAAQGREVGWLAGPRLTGMTAAQLEQLAAALASAQAARTKRYSQQRGGRARRATGNVSARPLFDDAARLVLILLCQRQVCRTAAPSVAARRRLGQQR